jgi:ATP-dependent metalloprotease
VSGAVGLSSGGGALSFGGFGSGGGSGSSAPGSKDSPIYMYQKTTFGTVFMSLLPILLLIGLLTFALGNRGESDLLGMKDELQLAQTPDETFANVIGDEEAKEDLSDIVQYLANPGKFTDLKATLPKGVLLIGPPGCGKTLMARALAGESGVPFLFTSGAEFEEVFVGVGARRVRKLFKRAKELAPCVVFIDEIDVIGANRDNFEFKSKYTLQQLLVEMDGFAKNSGVVVIAATNRPETLDPALTRSGRFDRKVYVSPPDVKARGEIIRLYLGDDKERIPKEYVDRLAKITTGFSGADLSNMVNSARIEAAKKGLNTISYELLNWAREMIAVGRERRSMVMTELEKRICAFHEVGHALAALHTPGSHPLEKATIIPRGQALGMTVYEPREEENLVTREALLAQLVTAMGGRAAEELIFGPSQITQGAGNDFQKATEIANQMVTRYGMSDKLGHVVYEKKRTHSEKRQQEIDDEVRAIVENAYSQAKKILTVHSDQLHVVANALLEHETLTADEIGKLMAGQTLTLKSPKSVLVPEDPAKTAKPLLPNPARLTRPAAAAV